VFKEGDVAHQTGDRLKQWSSRIETGLCHLAGMQQVLCRETGSTRLQTKTGETLEYDLCETVPVGYQIGEDTDEECLLDKPRKNVVIGAPAPEERGKRDVDDDQRGGDEGDLATEKAETAVDVAG